MALQTNRSDRWEKWFGACAEARAAVLSVLRHRYVRESQHAMRYRQHAEKIHYPEFREALISIAAEEEKHAEWIGAKIKDLGEKAPEVIPIHVAKEQTAGFTCERTLRRRSVAPKNGKPICRPSAVNFLRSQSCSNALTVTAKGIGSGFARCWHTATRCRLGRLEPNRFDHPVSGLGVQQIWQNHIEAGYRNN